MDAKPQSENGVLTLRVSGDLVSTNAETLRLDLGKLSETTQGTTPRWGLLRLDLSTAKMVDSVGLNLVVAALKTAQKRGAKMQVAYSSPNILRTFTFTRLDKHVELVRV